MQTSVCEMPLLWFCNLHGTTWAFPFPLFNEVFSAQTAVFKSIAKLLINEFPAPTAPLSAVIHLFALVYLIPKKPGQFFAIFGWQQLSSTPFLPSQTFCLLLPFNLVSYDLSLSTTTQLHQPHPVQHLSQIKSFPLFLFLCFLILFLFTPLFLSLSPPRIY